jgi:DNA-binding NarL/FixJ family response regulator
MRLNDERVPTAEGPGGRTDATDDHLIVSTIILGGTEETRLLLRGLVRLNRHRVLAETATADQLVMANPSDPSSVLILVADGDSDEWPHELATARQRQPTLRTILLVPERTPELIERARRMGVKGVLNRPFAIRDLVASVEAVARGEDILDRVPEGRRPTTGQP